MLKTVNNISLKRKSEKQQRQWFNLLLRTHGSVIPAIRNKVIICTIFSFFVAWIYISDFPLYSKSLDGIVPGLVLSLLLVFRTNTAYDKFWEGRKAWGTLINTSRNLARTIWVTVEEKEPEDHEKKIVILRLIVGFAVATKLHLRDEPVNEELDHLIPKFYLEKIKNMNNPPLEVAFWIGDYLQRQYQRNCINSYQLTALFELLNIQVDVLGICERIKKTPIPLAYSIHLKQLLFIYCLAFPFQVVNDLGWTTILATALVSFALFGIEEIGIEIENPFGYDYNDLPLDEICKTMEINIEDLITLSPCVEYLENINELENYSF